MDGPADADRDLTGLRVPLVGALRETGSPFDPFALVDERGDVVGAVSVFPREVQARGLSERDRTDVPHFDESLQVFHMWNTSPVAEESLEIGALVRTARERAGLSMNELAAVAGTSVSTISRIESGGLDPRWSTVEAVMAALGTTVDRERELVRNAKTARYRERLGNVFSAAQLVAPSYDPVELWTLLEGTTTGGKPLTEELAARSVARAYDQALAEALRRSPGSERDAVRAGADAVAAGASLAEGIARMAALLAVWAGRRLFIPADMKTSIASISDAARYAVAA